MPATPVPANPQLRSQRIFLRPSEREDIDLFLKWFNDAEVTRFLSFVSPMSRPMEERWFERMLDTHGRETYHFVICLRADGRPIGTIGFFDVDIHNGKAEFGISIGERELWGQGYGTEALEILLDFGFGSLRLERIYLHVYDFNQRARRSYDKVGFSLEGIERHAAYREGQYLDMLLMSMLRHEWEARTRARTWELP